jgi:general stress protein 26
MAEETTESESRKHLAEFLDKNQVGVLASTSRAGKPHAATIYFTHDQQLNIYFVTKKNTQKSRNLQENHQAAIAIYDASAQMTVQAEGLVMEVTDAKQTEWIFNDIWHIASRTSPNSAPPPSRLSAGAYVVYRLAAPSLRMATFVRQDPLDYDTIFEVINTQPSM